MSYLARETLVSAAINAVISVGFFLLAFDALQRITVWGLGNFAFDFLPQSFAIGLMATLVPGLLARRALAKGKLGGLHAAAPTAGPVVRRSLINAVLALVVGGGLWTALLWASGAQEIGWVPAFATKVLYGGALGGLVTALSLHRMLS